MGGRGSPSKLRRVQAWSALTINGGAFCLYIVYIISFISILDNWALVIDCYRLSIYFIGKPSGCCEDSQGAFQGRIGCEIHVQVQRSPA